MASHARVYNHEGGEGEGRRGRRTKMERGGGKEETWTLREKRKAERYAAADGWALASFFLFLLLQETGNPHALWLPTGAPAPENAKSNEVQGYG